MAGPLSSLEDRVKDISPFHKVDSCKDALAVPGVLNNPPYSDPRLFKVCMSLIYTGTTSDAWPCSNFFGDLVRIENTKERELQEDLRVDRHIIVKQINRLSYLSYGQFKMDTKLPVTIEQAIRDSGRGPKEFKNDIRIVYNPSDFSDPSPRTSYMDRTANKEEFIIYPEVGNTFSLNSNIFERLGARVIQKFSATIQQDKSCIIEFTLDIHQIGKVEYSTRIDNRLKAVPGNIPVAGTECAAQFFSGNPAKNTWFNTNRNNLSREYIKKGICYIVCKEFFGDIMIALFSLYYKQYAPNEEYKKAAIFTADNALTAVCKAWKINFVSKNWKQTKQTQECVAVLYNTSPEQELPVNKQRVVDTIMKLNTILKDNLENIIAMPEETYIQDVGKLNEFHKNFLGKIVRLIEQTNNELATVTGQDGIHNVNKITETLTDFEKQIKLYKVANVVRSVNPPRFARSISNPFKYVPSLPHIVMRGEFVITLQRLKSFDALLRGAEGIYTRDEIRNLEGVDALRRLQVAQDMVPLGRLRKVRQWGGTRKLKKTKTQMQIGGGFIFDKLPRPTEKNAREVYDVLDDPEILFQYQELYPTETLLTIIRRYIEEDYVMDIYNQLHFLFDINCVVCYNLTVLKILIADLSNVVLTSDIRYLNINQWSLYYSYLIENKVRPPSKLIYSSASSQANTFKSLAFVSTPRQSPAVDIAHRLSFGNFELGAAAAPAPATAAQGPSQNTLGSRTIVANNQSTTSEASAAVPNGYKTPTKPLGKIITSAPTLPVRTKKPMSPSASSPATARGPLGNPRSILRFVAAREAAAAAERALARAKADEAAKAESARGTKRGRSSNSASKGLNSSYGPLPLPLSLVPPPPPTPQILGKKGTRKLRPTNRRRRTRK